MGCCKQRLATDPGCKGSGTAFWNKLEPNRLDEWTGVHRVSERVLGRGSCVGKDLGQGEKRASYKYLLSTCYVLGTL